MKLEIGKYYKRRDGKIVGPVEVNQNRCPEYPYRVGDVTYTVNGCWFGLAKPQLIDLIEEVPNPNDDWQEVAKVGWPKKEDYPVWCWNPEAKLGKVVFARKPYDPDPDPCTQGYTTQEDRGITHWERAVVPSPPTPTADPKREQLLERLRKAKAEITEVEAQLEGEQ